MGTYSCESIITMLVLTSFLVIASCFPILSDPVSDETNAKKQNDCLLRDGGGAFNCDEDNVEEYRDSFNFDEIEEILFNAFKNKIKKEDISKKGYFEYGSARPSPGKINQNDDFTKSYFSDEVMYEKFGNCHDFPAYNDKPIYMVDACPVDASTEMAALCRYPYKEDICVIDIDNIPVQDWRGVVYRNIHCSRCHRAQNVSAWTAYLLFEEISALKLVDGLRSVKFLENLGDATNCTQKIYPYNQNAITHCTLNQSKIREKNYRARETPVDFPPQKATPVVPLSFQIIINFGINGQGHIIFNTEPIRQTEIHKCEENEVYYKGMCREVSCDDGYELIDYSCQPIPTIVTDDPEDTITTLKHIHKMSWITLRLNVSFDELMLLTQDGTDELLIKNIASLLNVSTSQITNFTVNLVNGSSSLKKIEINPMPLPEKEAVKWDSVVENDTKIAKSRDIHLKGRRAKDIPLDPDENAAPMTDNQVSPEIESEYYQSVNPDNNESTFEFGNSYPPYSVDQRFTVELKFALLAGTKKSNKENPLVNIVDTMQDMILTKSFNLVLNGTDFHVYNLTQANSEYTVDNWCSNPGHGEFKNMHSEKEFVIVTYRDRRTGRMVKGIYVNETQKYYGPDMYDLYIEVSGELGDIPNVTASGMVFVCDRPRIEDGKCAKITLNSTEYEILENQSILFKGEVFGLDKYEYINYTADDIRLCVYNEEVLVAELVKNSCGSDFKHVIVAEGYLSFVLGIISIVVTFTVLITYCILEKLRNLPGVCTMNLTLSLFLGDLLFITSGVAASETRWICQMMGVLLHYFFLASFFWMNVMSFDVFRTFANRCILTRIRKKRKYFPRYALYAWGSPAVIVLLCVIVDFTKFSQYLRIGYGGNSVDNDYEGQSSNFDSRYNISEQNRFAAHEQNLGCWIQEPVAALLAFGLPMFIILLSNAAMFTRTIICIRKTAKLVQFKTRRSSINHVTGKYDVMLYMRMSTVMGFTWIFGLASSIVSAFAGTPTFAVCIVLHILGLCFVIFNCSQGLLIFFAFVCNRRVLTYFKEVVNKVKARCQRNPSMSSSSASMSTISYRYSED